VEVARHRVDTLVGMQKWLLEAVEEQTHAAADSYREGKGLMAAARVAELARRGIEGFVETEKKFLDLAAHEVTAATKNGKNNGKPQERIEVLTKLARKSGEHYMDAQKKLLELAIQQLEMAKNVKSDRKTTARKSPQESLGELTEKSVRNLVAAEKSLLELAIHPTMNMAGHETHKAPRRARAKQTHVGAHKPAEHGTTAAA
jgi:hypothetical protein